MYFTPAFMALSASHTKSVNKAIERHFESVELTDTLLKPKDSIAGFVYFKIPRGTKKLEDLIVEVTVEADGPEQEVGETLLYRFMLSTLDLTPFVSSDAGPK
jgi:hypothetical protein